MRTAAAITSSTSTIPATGSSRAATSSASRASNCARHRTAASAPQRSAISASIAVFERPRNSAAASSAVNAQPNEGPRSRFTDSAIGSLSTSTPSQSNSTSPTSSIMSRP